MKNKALLVGINQYPDPGNALRGCVNDIIDMEHFIAEKRKVYKKEAIRKLTDRAATKQGIIAGIQWLMDGALAGDQLLFHYSGHGAQVPTKSKQIERDGLDEIICPYNFDGSRETALSDKEFAQLFARIPKGVHFVWISDSCHAEDLSREPKQAMAFRSFKFPTPNNWESIGHPTSPLNGALLSACAAHQLSADAYIENRFNGAFTHYLLKHLAQLSESAPMSRVIEMVRKDLERNGYDQDPQSEGLLEGETFFQ